MLDQVQVIKNEQDVAEYAVIPYADYLLLRDLLNDPEKLTDYLDYLHMQRVKAVDETRVSLADVEEILNLD